MKSSWHVSWVLLLAVVILFQGCATPVGVRPLDSKEANRRLTETVLSDGILSAPTLQILNRAGLEDQFQSEPTEVITALHKALPTAREADRLFALAEISFLHAVKSGDRSFFFAAAVYAYAFLFPQGSGASPDPFDPRFRTAVDLYNRGISGGFAEPENRQGLRPCTRPCPLRARPTGSLPWRSFPSCMRPKAVTGPTSSPPRCMRMRFSSRRILSHPRTRSTPVFEPPSIFTTGAFPGASPSRKTGRCLYRRDGE